MFAFRCVVSSSLLFFSAACATGSGTSTETSSPKEPPARTPGSYLLYVSGSGGEEIEGFRFDAKVQALTSIGRFPVGPRATYLAADPTGRFVFATNEVDEGTVRSFAVDPISGALRAQNSKPTGGAAAVHVAVHPSAQWVFVSNYVGGNVRVFPIDADGTLGDPTDTEVTGDSSHQIVYDPAGRYVSVPCRGPNTVSRFEFDAASGELTPQSALASDDPRHIAYSPNAKFAFLLNEDPANVVTYRYHAETGAFEQTSKLALGEGEAWGAHIVVSKDGRFVFASGRNTNAIVSFAVDPETGVLSEVNRITKGIKVPRDFTVSPDGEHLWVANQGSASVSRLSVSSAGELRSVGSPIPTVGEPQAVIWAGFIP